ncbi:MAG: YciI family protein [Nitrospira sp.]
MKFILLVHHDESAFEQMSEETKRGLLAESIRLCHQLDAKGEYLHASPVHPAATATLVRVREGKAFVTDGPFIETREQMAGYFLIEAKDLEEATAIATRVPGARIGTVEVRPLIEVTDLPE